MIVHCGARNSRVCRKPVNEAYSHTLKAFRGTRERKGADRSEGRRDFTLSIRIVRPPVDFDRSAI